ncbi:MAG: twin-arginine translocation signal domain-containing protein [Pseudomonadota bacterium]
MQKKTEGMESSRRDFLKMTLTAAPAAAAVAVTGTTAQAAVEAPTSLGLQKTEHVKKYLDSARF